MSFAAVLLLNILSVRQSQGQEKIVAKQTSAPFICETTTGKLHGTLEEPSDTGKIPLVLIIAGSGPTDRNGNNPMMTNNSLKMLAQGLVQKGIAVARFDKRGIAESKQAGGNEGDLRFETYIGDATEIIRFFQSAPFTLKPRYSSVTIVGHSEGSLIGMVAAQKVGAQGFVSLAGTGFPAAQILRKQLAKQLPLNLIAESETILKSLESGKTLTTQVPQELYSIYRPSVQPYMISWFRYDPREEMRRLRCPVLILQGSTDIQVSLDDANALRTAKPDAKFLIIDGMNHVLKAVPADVTQQMASYNNPALPVVPTVIETIAAFVHALPKQK